MRKNEYRGQTEEMHMDEEEEFQHNATVFEKKSIIIINLSVKTNE